MKARIPSGMIRQCKELGTSFEIDAKDLAFYERISPVFGGKRFLIPPPTLSPEARNRRRLTFRNERTLYRRRCDKTGQHIVSIYAPEAPFPVYDHDYWFSDDWDAKSYGREFDFTRPFFEQFAELAKVVPMYSLYQQRNNENSPYTNLGSGNRNCYYVFAGSDNEDCYYSTYIQRCQDVSDSFFIFDSELCYECIDCYHCYNTTFLQDCENCTDSHYLTGCIGCSNCFGCVSLIKATYCIFNEQYSKAEYEKQIAQILSLSNSAEFVATNIGKLTAEVPRKFYSGNDIETSTGDHLAHCKSAENCFDCTNLEECKNCTWLHQCTNCYDCYAWGLKGELGLENHLVGANFYNVMFSEMCSRDVSELLYCRACYGNCMNLFGCIGLKQTQYAILNRPYSKEQYELLVPQIIEHMRKTGEWGEFFPQWLSPFGYNETVAAEYFPLSRAEVIAKGWNYRDEPLPGVYGEIAIPWNMVTSLLESVSEELLGKIFCCETSGKNFRYTKGELALYKKLKVLPPKNCFDARYRRRFERRNPRKLVERECLQCGETILSSYAADRPEQVVCERCFRY